MEMRKFESLDATVSLVGFGAMRLPLLSEDPADVDIGATCGMVREAVAGGINYFDTAYVYHKGKSEGALKKALVERFDRESYYLADKLSIFACDNAEDMKDMFETQLERCGVDYFDFYLLHSITHERYERQTAFGAFDFMKSLKDSGRARRIGFSFHSTPEMLEKVISEHPEFEFVQLQINFQDWREQSASEDYRIAREHGLPVIVMEPIKGGSLARLPQGASALRGDLSTPAGQAEFALRFAASLDGVKVVLSGMSAPEQVRDNVKAFSSFKKFTDADMDLTERILGELRKISLIPCTACGYCVEGCPIGINIPKIFAIYNEFKRTGVAFSAQFLYSSMKPGTRADSCVSCGACRAICPQGINVPGELAALHPQLPLIPLVPPRNNK